MNSQKKVIIIGCDLASGSSVGSIVEAIMNTKGEVHVVACQDPVPIPFHAQRKIDPAIIDPVMMADENIYRPKSKRERKSYQRPYKYHR